jgi:hypothetical protein
MTKLNIIDGGRDKSADPWKDAFKIEPHIHDFRRMIELARLMWEDSDTTSAFCIHETRDKAEALSRKWTELWDRLKAQKQAV